MVEQNTENIRLAVATAKECLAAQKSGQTIPVVEVDEQEFKDYVDGYIKEWYDTLNNKLGTIGGETDG